MGLNFKQFVESTLGSFVYTLPKDKEEQLYDFYLLSALPGVADENIHAARDQTYGVLLPTLKHNLLDAVFFSICSELRHIFDSIYTDQDHLHHYFRDDTYKTFQKYKKAFDEAVPGSLTNFGLPSSGIVKKGPQKGERKKYSVSWDAAKNSGASEEEIVKLAFQAFGSLEWEPAYGGDKWADIARGWLNLDKAQSRGDIMIYIDRVYQLQHNNDTVFNKIRRYTKGGKYDWIQKALDHKFRIKSPYELMNKVSPEMKRLAGFILKASKGTSLEGFEQQREREFNKKFKDSGIRRIRLPSPDNRTLEIKEKDLKAFARKAISGDLDEGIVDLYIEYGDVLMNEHNFNELIKIIDITPTHKIVWARIQKIVDKRAKEYVRKNYRILQDIVDKHDWDKLNDAIGQALKVSSNFASSINYLYNNFSAWPRMDTPGDQITHAVRSEFGEIIFNLPNSIGAFFRGKGTTVNLDIGAVEKIRRYASVGEEEGLLILSQYLPSLDPKVQKMLLNYIVKMKL